MIPIDLLRPKKNRRSRYRRDPNFDDRKIQLMSRDYIFLSALSEYRFLTTKQIKKLFFPSYERACKRLWLLWQHGFVDRNYLPVSRDEGSSQAIYSLNRKGATIVAEKHGMELSEIPYCSSSFRSSTSLYNHTLKRNDFRICLQLACQTIVGIEVLFWWQDPSDIADKVYIPDCHGEKVRIPLVPDGFFGINTPNWKYYFLVEIDRTVGYSTYGNKLKGYYQWFVEGGHIKKYGVENIRILTITYPSRLEKLIKLALKVRNDLNGSGIFWLTTFDQISIEEPDRILTDIWQIAHKDKKGLHALIK